MTFWIIFALYVLPIIVHLIRAISTDDQSYSFDNPHSYYMWIGVFIPIFNIILHFKGDWTCEAREKDKAIKMYTEYTDSDVIEFYSPMGKRFVTYSPSLISKGDVIIIAPEEYGYYAYGTHYKNGIYRYARIVGVTDTNYGLSDDGRHYLVRRRFLVKDWKNPGENIMAFTVDIKRNRHIKEVGVYSENIPCIVRKKVKVHEVENVYFYIQDGKVYNLPKYQEGYTLYYVVRDGHATLELVKEEV